MAQARNGRENGVKVSVLMPVYNASQYVEEAIESVLAQDYGPFELLIADDGSKDSTLEVISQYKRHPKVRIYSNKKNLGSGATRNRLVRLTKSEYITPCDSDDLMLPGNLRKLSHFLDAHSRIGVVYGDLLVLEVDKDNAPLSPPCVLGGDHDQVWDLLDNAVNHPGSMIRKSLILKVGGYDETVYSVDDWSLWLKLAEITKFKHLKGEIYYVWKRRSTGLTKTNPRRRSDVLKIVSEAIERRYDIRWQP